MAQGGFRWTLMEKRTCVFHVYYCWPTFDSSLIAPEKSALTVVCHLIEVFCNLERFSDSEGNETHEKCVESYQLMSICYCMWRR